MFETDVHLNVTKLFQFYCMKDWSAYVCSLECWCAKTPHKVGNNFKKQYFSRNKS